MAGAGHSEKTDSGQSIVLQTTFCPIIWETLQRDDTLGIMANPDGSVWIDQRGVGLVCTDHRLSADDRERVIRLVASGIRETVSCHTPVVSAELPGSGDRFEGLLPPVSTAPCFSIRKVVRVNARLEDYVERGALSQGLALSLRSAITARENILIAGAGSSGKTRFANALLAERAFAEDRIIIIEDYRELDCTARNCIRLRPLPGKVSVQTLLHSGLRLRPGRIIIGEIHGAETLDLLKAWNNGHPGGLTTIHANSAAHALRRLEQLTLEAAHQIPFDLILETVNIIVFMSSKFGLPSIEDAIRIIDFDGEGYVTAPLTPHSPVLVHHKDPR